ncbi:RraA family protein [Ottowia thiooxydans]|uniref:RraA family protein n=1 Tax=Ottowia thiooxydans TaxID=219182 RepID=UPI0003F759A7|nr:RraA family protein [Ottowia thiooxydans]
MTGFRVLKRRRCVDPATVERFRGLPVANISDSMHRMSAAGPRLRPLHGGGYLAGAALTVKARPGDNLMVHKALAMAVPGDVIVVDAGGDLTNSLVGELMTSFAISRGVAGMVINGSVRDLATIRAGQFPVYAAGVSHRGPYKDGPGEINVPIALDGMLIEPGDLIVGDEDGLLCVPLADVGRVHAAAVAKGNAEAATLAATIAGKKDLAWLDAELTRLGCYIEE